MKTYLNNLWYDTLKKLDYFLYGFFGGIAEHFKDRGMYHSMKHIQTEEDRKRISKWLDRIKCDIEAEDKPDDKSFDGPDLYDSDAGNLETRQ